MNLNIIILRIVWLLFGLSVGYDLSKWVNLDNYEVSLLFYIPAFLALMTGEILYAKMASLNGENLMSTSPDLQRKPD